MCPEGMYNGVMFGTQLGAAIGVALVAGGGTYLIARILRRSR